MVNRDTLRGTLPFEQLVYAVEDVFAVSLSEEQASSISTVGDLYEHILANFDIAQQEGCLSSIAFYKFRQALMNCGVPRDAVKLNTTLSSLFPAEERKLQWLRLRNELWQRLPELRFPNWLEGTLGLIAFTMIFVAFGALFSKAFIVAAASAAIIYAVFAFDRTRPRNTLAIEIPSGYETVGQAVTQIVSWNYAELATQSGKWNREELFRSLQQLIAYICAARPEEITAETKFADLDFE